MFLSYKTKDISNKDKSFFKVSLLKDVRADEDKEKPAELQSFISEEELDLKKKMFEELERKKQELEFREQAFKEEEQRLENLKIELDRKLKEITKVKNRIEEIIKQEEVKEENKLLHLVKVYENMKPREAATTLGRLENEIVIEIMSRMSQRKAAKVFDKMDAKRAAEITKLIRQQKNKLK